MLCFRCNVGTVRQSDGTFFNTGLPPGFPDLLILTDQGTTIYCEVKAPGGKQRPDQVNFMNRIREMNHIYILVYNLNQFIEEVTKYAR